MGKTKTAFVNQTANKEKSGAVAYEEKMKKKAEKLHLSGSKGGQKITTVEGQSQETPVIEEVAVKTKKVHVRSSKYQEFKSKIDKNRTYSIIDAVALVKSTNIASFGGSVELHMVVRKTGLSVNVSLPHFAGKEKKIEVANDETVKKLTSGKIDFDVLLATPDMMPKLVPFARMLGPKGLMPNPKNGTLISNIAKAKDFSASGVTIKTEKDAPVIHTVVGKVSQKDDELVENTKKIIDTIDAKQIVKAYLKATMSPSVRLNLN